MLILENSRARRITPALPFIARLILRSDRRDPSDDLRPVLGVSPCQHRVRDDERRSGGAASDGGSATAGETITLIRAHSGRLAKRVHPDARVDNYDKAFLFDLAEHPLANLAALADLLHRLLSRRDTAVVRGAILDPARTRRVRRLLLPDQKTGGVPTLREVPRRWLALDMEGIPLPAGMPAADLEGCYRIALATLPAAFRSRACIVQASGSHGFKPDLRLRLWFWLDRPLNGAELKRWLRHTPADPSVFGAVQPIYTAAPVMTDGAPDPLPRRLIVIPGAALVTVPSPSELNPVRFERCSFGGRVPISRG